MFNAAQGIEHALGADIGIKQAERRIAAKRRIRRLEPIDCGGRVVKHFTRAADDPSQPQELRLFFAVQYPFALPTGEGTLRNTKGLSKLRLR